MKNNCVLRQSKAYIASEGHEIVDYIHDWISDNVIDHENNDGISAIVPRCFRVKFGEALFGESE